MEAVAKDSKTLMRTYSVPEAAETCTCFGPASTNVNLKYLRQPRFLNTGPGNNQFLRKAQRRRSRLDEVEQRKRHPALFAEIRLGVCQFRQFDTKRWGYVQLGKRGCNVANRTIHSGVFFAVKMFFGRIVPADLLFVLVLRREKMVGAPQQPKQRIDTRKCPGSNTLSRLSGCSHLYFFVQIPVFTEKTPTREKKRTPIAVQKQK